MKPAVPIIDFSQSGNGVILDQVVNPLTDPKKAHYQQLNLNSRGGYDLTPEAFVYHPNPAVCRMWAQQHEASK